MTNTTTTNDQTNPATPYMPTSMDSEKQHCRPWSKTRKSKKWFSRFEKRRNNFVKNKNNNSQKERRVLIVDEIENKNKRSNNHRNVRRSARLAAGSTKSTAKAADSFPIPEFDVFEDTINDVGIRTKYNTSTEEYKVRYDNRITKNRNILQNVPEYPAHNMDSIDTISSIILDSYY